MEIITSLYTAIFVLIFMFSYILVYYKSETKSIHIKNDALITEKEKEIAELIKTNEYFIKKYNAMDRRYQQTQKALDKLSNEVHSDIILRDRKIDELNKTIDQLTSKLIESHNDKYSKGLIC